MKVAVTAQGRDLTSEVDPRFGRARFFVVVDTETRAISVHDNARNLNAAQGAGIQAAQNVVELGVDAVLTGHVGPKACTALQAGEVKVYLGASGSVSEAIEGYEEGRLGRADQADVEGHRV